MAAVARVRAAGTGGGAKGEEGGGGGGSRSEISSAKGSCYSVTSLLTLLHPPNSHTRLVSGASVRSSGKKSSSNWIPIGFQALSS